MLCSRQGLKLKLVEQLLMRTASKLPFRNIGNPVTDHSIVLTILISSYKVFYLHVKCVDEIHVSSAQLVLNAVYTYYARYSNDN